VQCARARNREIGEQGRALRLARERVDVLSVRPSELRWTEKPELQHDNTLANGESPVTP